MYECMYVLRKYDSLTTNGHTVTLYECMYVCVCMYVCMYIKTFSMYSRMYVLYACCMYTLTSGDPIGYWCIRMYVYMYYKYICMYVYSSIKDPYIGMSNA